MRFDEGSASTQRQRNDVLKTILNDLAVQRMAAKHRGGEDKLRRIDEDERETREHLGQPAVRVLRGARTGETISI